MMSIEAAVVISIRSDGVYLDDIGADIDRMVPNVKVPYDWQYFSGSEIRSAILSDDTLTEYSIDIANASDDELSESLTRFFADYPTAASYKGW